MVIYFEDEISTVIRMVMEVTVFWHIYTIIENVVSGKEARLLV